jgi:aldehyde:ferredoxin oxidoreductase
MAAAERAFNVYKAVNAREGFRRQHDKFPDRWMKDPLKFGDRELRIMDYFRTRNISAEDFERILDSYYEEHGWDVRQGVPTKEKLASLGLAEIGEDLERAGVYSH